ncbi:MAG: hypothetical protein ACLFNN_01950 [Candidatus Paceibacterota bacterium]
MEVMEASATRGLEENRLEVFPVFSTGQYPVSQLLIHYYCWWPDWLTDKKFPVKRHSTNRVGITYVGSFQKDPTHKGVVRKALENKFRVDKKMIHEEVLLFGIEYYQEIWKNPIVFIHKPILGPKKKNYVFALKPVPPNKRMVLLTEIPNRWSKDCLFASFFNL